MEPEFTIKEIRAALKSFDYSIPNLKARAEKEKWVNRVSGDKEVHYITVMLPEYIQIALKAFSVIDAMKKSQKDLKPSERENLLNGLRGLIAEIEG